LTIFIVNKALFVVVYKIKTFEIRHKTSIKQVNIF